MNAKYLKENLVATKKIEHWALMGVLLIGINLLFLQTIDAKVKLPAIVSSNMVLQRNTVVELWGWADAKEKITIQVSWLDEPLRINAKADGSWRTQVKTTNSKLAQTITITDESTTVRLTNILFGEVWICSGQSNMQMPVQGFNGQPVIGSQMTIAKSTNPNLRLFSVDSDGAKAPLDDVQGYTSWQEATPESVSNFSAVGYMFGAQLQEILDVPVGLVHTSWGGSSVQAWISTEGIKPYQKVDLNQVDISKKTKRIPTALFNAMVSPLIPYTIKGALWYQAEANRKEPEQYKQLFPAMVKDWRSRWGIGNFPFYYVQIAPFAYGNIDAFQTVENSAFIREAQLQCLDLIPNSGIAITMDIGDAKSIHPPRKREVAQRLLYNALNQTYGYTAVDYAGPKFDTLEQKDNGIVLKFKYAETGLYAYNSLEGFEIAGKDKVFHPATAKIVNKRKEVFVKSSKVPEPVAVRYGWRNAAKGTLYDTSLLPASSFRTDNWKDATLAKENQN